MSDFKCIPFVGAALSMRKLLIAFLFASVPLAHTIDNVKTSTTPEQGRQKIKTSLKSSSSKKLTAEMTNKQRKNTCVNEAMTGRFSMHQGTADGSTTNTLMYMVGTDSLANVGGVFIPVGLVSGGSIDNAAAIQTAIDAAPSAGGGTVMIPEGAFLVRKAAKTTTGDIPRIFLYSTSSNVSIVGAGRGATKIYTTYSIYGYTISRGNKSNVISSASINSAAGVVTD